MTSALRRALARPSWIALGATIAAFGIAALVSGLTTPRWRAEIAIVVGTGAGPLRPGENGATEQIAERLDDLVLSHQIAANIVSTLRLDESPDSVLAGISVAIPGPGLLRVRVEDQSKLRAPQIAQEIGFLFPRLLEHRFPKLQAEVWDPARLMGRTSRHWAQSLGAAGGLSVLVWTLAGIALLRRGGSRQRGLREPAFAHATGPSDLPRPAPKPADAPLHLPVDRNDELVTEPGPEAEPEPEPELEPEPEPAPQPKPEPDPKRERGAGPEPQPEAQREPEPPAVAAERGDWNLKNLEQLVGEHAAEYPDRAEEWGFYLESMREVADADGQLPASLDWLVWETFAPVLEG